MMTSSLPPPSAQGIFFFAFFAFFISASILYVAAEWLPRHLRLFHYIATLITAISSLSYLILAGTYLGFILVDGAPVYWVRYVDLALTVPLLLLALGLLSSTRLTETLFLSAIACVMSLSQLLTALHPESNRWLFFTLNLLLLIPPLSALTSGYRAQAAIQLGGAVATRVGHLSLIVFLYLVVQQLFLLLSHCLYYIETSNDLIALTLADGQSHTAPPPPLTPLMPSLRSFSSLLLPSPCSGCEAGVRYCGDAEWGLDSQGGGRRPAVVSGVWGR